MNGGNSELGLRIAVSGGAAAVAEANQVAAALKTVGRSIQQVATETSSLPKAGLGSIASFQASLAKLGPAVAALPREGLGSVGSLQAALARLGPTAVQAGAGIGASRVDVEKWSTAANTAALTIGTGKGGGSTLLGALTGTTAAAIVAGAAFKIASAGLRDIAENESATSTLAAFKLSAEDTARAMRDIEGLKFITGDKVSAAQLWGKVLNGNTAILRQYGIEIDDAAGQVERLGAINELVSRGLEKQTAALGTMVGQWDLLKDNAANKAGNLFGADWIERGLEGINLWLMGFKDRRAMLDHFAPRVDSAALAMKKAIPVGVEYASSFETITKSTTSATRALEGFERQSAALKAQLEEQNDNADVKLQQDVAAIEEAKATGALTPEAAAKARRAAEAEANVRKAERAQQNANERVGSANQAFDQIGAAQVAAGREFRRLPEGKEKDKAGAELDALDKQAEEATKARAAAAAEAKKADADVERAKAQARVAKAQSDFETRTEKESADKERRKAQDDFKKNAETLKKEAAKQAEEKAEQRKPGQTLAGSLEEVAVIAPATQNKASLRARAKRIREGTATDADIEAAEKESSKILGKRASSGGRKTREKASELQSRISSEADAAKGANDAGVASASDAAKAAAENMKKEVISALNAIAASLGATAGAASSAESKATQAQRTAGRGG